jgi:hypothetical protein
MPEAGSRDHPRNPGGSGSAADLLDEFWNLSKSNDGIALKEGFRDIASRTARYPLRY